MAPRRTITPSPPPESLKIGQSSGLHFYLSLLFRLARLVVGFFSCCAPSYLEDDALFFSSSSSFVPTCRLPIVAAGPVVVALLAFFSLYIYFFSASDRTGRTFSRSRKDIQHQPAAGETATNRPTMARRRTINTNRTRYIPCRFLFFWSRIYLNDEQLLDAEATFQGRRLRIFFVQVSFCFLQLAAQRDSIEPSVFFSIKKTVGSGS